MPRTKTTSTTSTKTRKHSPSRPALDQFTNPLKLVDHIENDANNEYWKWVEALTDAATFKEDPDVENDVSHLRQTSAGLDLQTAARHAGFVIGFEYAARLFKGRDASKLPGGVR